MQTVLITGAASGIGRDTARLFAESGWQCVLVDYNTEALQQLGQSLPAPASASHVLRAVDLTDRGQIASLAEGMPALDALLNNAGMSDTTQLPLAEQSSAQLERLLALNLAAPAAMVETCAPMLKPGARIVNVSSGAGLHAIPWRGAYSPSKAGLIAQTKALAQARPDWCVTILAPGFVRTELLDALIQAGRLDPTNAVSKIPLGRMAMPAEMAQAHYFLASTGAYPLSGQILAVNGGSSIYGGSQRFAPAALAPLPLDLPLDLEVIGGDSKPWQALAPSPSSGPHYAARLDLSALHSEPGRVLEAVHAAGANFAAAYPQAASLTVLLPAGKAYRWQDAGDMAAARMLVSTFACEWGGRALRVNALEVPQNQPPLALHPLLRFVCGPAAQYLTGQILFCGSLQESAR